MAHNTGQVDGGCNALVGGVLAGLSGKDVASGAIGEGSAPLVARAIAKEMYGSDNPETLTQDQKTELSQLSSVAGGLLGALASQGNAVDAQTAVEAAKNEVENNSLGKKRDAQREKARADVANNRSVSSVRIVVASDNEDQLSDKLLKMYRLHLANPSVYPPLTDEQTRQFAGFVARYLQEMGPKATQDLLAGKVRADYSFAYTLFDDSTIKQANQMRTKAADSAPYGLQTLTYLTWSRPKGVDEQIYDQSLGLLRVNGVHEGQAAIGTPALTFMSGPVGAAVRFLEVAAGGLQVGTGTRQLADGKVVDGGLNIGAGLLGVSGAAGTQLQLTRSSKTITGGYSGVNYEPTVSRVIQPEDGLPVRAVTGRDGSELFGFVPDKPLTIASNPAAGNPAAIARGMGDLNARQAAALEELPGFGSQTILHKSFGQRDLAALSAATGDEFAMFSAGGRRLVMRDDFESVPITPEIATDLASKGWRWSSHVHPGFDTGVLRSSLGDQVVLGAMQGNQSAIFNSMGQRAIFTPAGDSLNGWIPW
ncbi:hypothetical protein THUN1379_06720 [Paludibacterium sp. THUN1379]|uniref:VENN motif pre-toxin domain-containing protein n=1 Tax=Paludibacterium sp. THUN1379 TaxID=3112107 RepID=UPI00308B7339|nr:hypothetical protein THUN1379_06720 [Paludibacterium sp. THUN1379]